MRGFKMRGLKYLVAACVLTVAIFASVGAYAATLIGDVISVELDGPTYGTVICSSSCFSPSTFTVVAGQISTSYIVGGVDIVDFTFTDHGFSDIWNQPFTSPGATTVGGFSNSSAPTAAPFYGFVFTVISGNLFPPLVGGGGQRQGTGDEFAFDSGAVFASNEGSANFLPGDVDFGVFASATPLPAALPLFAGGAGLIGLLARRRKRKTAAALAAA